MIWYWTRYFRLRYISYIFYLVIFFIFTKMDVCWYLQIILFAYQFKYKFYILAANRIRLCEPILCFVHLNCITLPDKIKLCIWHFKRQYTITAVHKIWIHRAWNNENFATQIDLCKSKWLKTSNISILIWICLKMWSNFHKVSSKIWNKFNYFKYHFRDKFNLHIGTCLVSLFNISNHNVYYDITKFNCFLKIACWM